MVKAKHALGGASPVSNSTVDDFSLGGGNSSSNELLLNGVPNMQDSGRTAGFSPQLDAVNEVRVDVFGANVEYGDTSGGTVNGAGVRVVVGDKTGYSHTDHVNITNLRKCARISRAIIEHSTGTNNVPLASTGKQHNLYSVKSSPIGDCRTCGVAHGPVTYIAVRPSTKS